MEASKTTPPEKNSAPTTSMMTASKTSGKVFLSTEKDEVMSTTSITNDMSQREMIMAIFISIIVSLVSSALFAGCVVCCLKVIKHCKNNTQVTNSELYVPPLMDTPPFLGGVHMELDGFELPDCTNESTV